MTRIARRNAPAKVASLSLLIAAVFFSPVLAQDAPQTKSKRKSAAARSLSDTQLYKALLPSVCWVRTGGPAGDPGSAIGTGFVVDVDRKLVVTNEHVVKGFSDRGYDQMIVHFAEYDGDGRLIVDPNHYRGQKDALRGEVIHRDAGRDLALIKLPSLPKNAKAVTLASDLPEPGDRLISIAGLPQGSEGLWIMTTGSVRMAYRRSHANGAVAGVVETDMPTNRGNSGGPIVNAKNELVAVCEGAQNEARLGSMMIDVNEVRAFLEICDELVEPATAEAFFNRGSLRHNARRWEAALADYAAALKLEPTMALAATNRGWIFVSMDDHATGEAEFSAALALDAEIGSAYEGRGVCRREVGRNDEAIADFTQAIRRSPDYAHLYFRRAIAHRNKNDLPAALADLNRAVALDPNTADNFGSRGQVHRLLKNYKEAIADFDTASRLDPRGAVWYYEAGKVFADQESWQPVINLNSIAIQLDNSTPQYFNDRGLSHYNLGRNAEALSDYLAAIKLNPKSDWYAVKAGDCLWNLDRVREAWEFYNQAVQLNPQNARAWRSRGDVYKHLGDSAQAGRDFAKAKSLESK